MKGTIQYNSIRPGKVWLDTDGNRIQAHGGSVFYTGGKFWWVGENKEKSVDEAKIWHWGVRLYSSNDLYNWDSEGIILPAETEDESSPLHYKSKMDRPHIIYNDKTKKYVMWMKIMKNGKGEKCYYVVAACDKINGRYEIIRNKLSPCGMNVGDFDFYKDADTGKAYVIFERVHDSMIIMDLTADYTDVTSEYTVHFERPFPPFVREAPAVFNRDGELFLFTSGTTAKFPNPSEVASSNNIHGPWKELGDPHVGDKKHTSFDSQISCVLKHPFVKDLYIACADRWLVDLPDDLPNMCEVFEHSFDPHKESLYSKETINSFSKKNTSLADYVWLPVEFCDGKPCLRWRDEWTVEEFAHGNANG